MSGYYSSPSFQIGTGNSKPATQGDLPPRNDDAVEDYQFIVDYYLDDIPAQATQPQNQSHVSSSPGYGEIPNGYESFDDYYLNNYPSPVQTRSIDTPLHDNHSQRGRKPTRTSLTSTHSSQTVHQYTSDKELPEFVRTMTRFSTSADVRVDHRSSDEMLMKCPICNKIILRNNPLPHMQSKHPERFHKPYTMCFLGSCERLGTRIAIDDLSSHQQRMHPECFSPRG